MALSGKRIIIVVGSLDLGGAERQALLLAKGLREVGAKVEFWGLTGKQGRVAEICMADGIPWKMMPFHLTWNRWDMLIQWLRLTLQLRRANPDLLLPYTHIPNVACGVIWRLTGACACIWNQRDMGNVGRMPGLKERWAVRHVSILVANSRVAADFLISEFSVPESRVRVIHNGVLLPAAVQSRDTWRESLCIQKETLVACMVANLTSFKDHETLLRAWRIVLDASSDGNLPLLLLAGYQGETTRQLKALAFDLDLGKQVRFLGAVVDVSGLLEAVDLGVFSSRQESLPNGILECMAAGLAVVATNIPGNAEALGVDLESCLVPPGDAASLAGAILSMINQPGERLRIGFHNKKRCQKEFSEKKATLAMISEIELLSEGRL